MKLNWTQRVQVQEYPAVTGRGWKLTTSLNHVIVQIITNKTVCSSPQCAWQLFKIRFEKHRVVSTTLLVQVTRSMWPLCVLYIKSNQKARRRFKLIEPDSVVTPWKRSSSASCINTWDYISGQRLLSTWQKYSLSHPSQGWLESYVSRQRRYWFGSLQAAVSCFSQGWHSVRTTSLRAFYMAESRSHTATPHWLQDPPLSFNSLIQWGHSGFTCQREQRSGWPQGQRLETVHFWLQAWMHRCRWQWRLACC